MTLLRVLNGLRLLLVSTSINSLDNPLTTDRTRVEFHGRPASEHDTSSALVAESTRVESQKGILLPFLADNQDGDFHVQGFGAP